MMIRTQIQLTQEQMDSLRELSRTSGRSMSELIRTGIDHYLAKPASNEGDRFARAIKAAGKFSSGHTDVSRNHDRYLAEALKP